MVAQGSVKSKLCLSGGLVLDCLSICIGKLVVLSEGGVYSALFFY